MVTMEIHDGFTGKQLNNGSHGNAWWIYMLAIVTMDLHVNNCYHGMSCYGRFHFVIWLELLWLQWTATMLHVGGHSPP